PPFDLAEQVAGKDPATGNPLTLNGSINALFLRNNGGQSFEPNADNSTALSAKNVKHPIIKIKRNNLPFPRLSYLSFRISHTLHQSQIYSKMHGE
ncbi:MAG: hypothetical protein WB053_05280, partial [Nitrososphaeraceae archaeon]